MGADEGWAQTGDGRRRVTGPLGRAWVGAVSAIGGADPAGAEAIERAYGQPHRRYHTATHVQAVLRDSTALADDLALDEHTTALIRLAACAHDVVYEGRAGDDERASAAWAANRLSVAGVAERDVAEVERLVLTTADHTAVLLDADLAVLGSSPEAYGDYVAAVREEYRHVPDDAWRERRGAVLRSLLGRPGLYLTESARARWDARARANMQGELEELER